MSNAAQVKAGTRLQMDTEKLARRVLADVLPWAMQGFPNVTRLAEYGGVIYVDEGSQKLGLTVYAEPGNSVKVHLSNDDKSRPERSRPLAFYHTHPYPKSYVLSGRTMSSAFDSFEGDDKGASDDYQVPGYLAVSDGSFWRFDPTPYDPNRPTFVGPGTMTRLNGQLSTRASSPAPAGLDMAVAAIKKKYAKYIL